MKLLLAVSLTSLFSLTAIAADPPTAPDCKELFPIVVTGFSWHNSTNNCGCDDGGCLPTGYPASPGCGPPDTAQATFETPNTGVTRTCYRADPGSVPSDVIPSEGEHSCLSLGTRWTFGERWISFTDPNVVCPNGRWQVSARGPFEYDCTEDSFGNSTCTQREPIFTIPIIDTGFTG